MSARSWTADHPDASPEPNGLVPIAQPERLGMPAIQPQPLNDNEVLNEFPGPI
jgi:hypothetical protein